MSIAAIVDEIVSEGIHIHPRTPQERREMKIYTVSWDDGKGAQGEAVVKASDIAEALEKVCVSTDALFTTIYEIKEMQADVHRVRSR